MTPEQRDLRRARSILVLCTISEPLGIDDLAAEFAIVRAEAMREAMEAAALVARLTFGKSDMPVSWTAGQEISAGILRALAAAPAAREEGK